jgi:hypothetical protein
MKEMELWALLCVRCLLAVEKDGTILESVAMASKKQKRRQDAGATETAQNDIWKLLHTASNS